MTALIDLLYLALGLLLSPFWLTRMALKGKLRTDWPGRFGRAGIAPREDGRPRLLIHAVSVGEVNSVRQLVERLDQEFDIVISATTDTGFARATELYAGSATVVRYPFDFAFAVRRFLNAIRPDAVALVELEIWPNFTAECRRRDIPVVVVNGRLSEPSFEGYRRIRPFVRPTFERLHTVAVQNELFAERFRQMGVDADRIRVLGTMKWDTAEIADDVAGADDLAAELGVDPRRPVVVAGSTGPEEEALIHDATPADVQLIIAPRKPERFDEAAATMPGCVRRTDTAKGGTPHFTEETRPTRFLLDTIGELRKAYALATVVIVGRTFVELHGSDMIEPVALGKATVVGPSVTNFDTVVKALLEGGGLVQIEREELAATIRRLLDDEAERRQLAEAGRAVVQANQGATERHAELIREIVREHRATAATPAPVA
ncbi:MAG: 3-deoxy-D-manno-octulosonic acid transferase [Phycisphaerales bacterium]